MGTTLGKLFPLHSMLKTTRLELGPDSSPTVTVEEFQADQNSWPLLGMIPDSQPTNSPNRKHGTMKDARSLLGTSSPVPRIEDLFSIIEEKVRAQNASGDGDRSSYPESSDVEMSKDEAFISKRKSDPGNLRQEHPLLI